VWRDILPPDKQLIPSHLQTKVRNFMPKGNFNSNLKTLFIVLFIISCSNHRTSVRKES
jgi:hypothetical protein